MLADKVTQVIYFHVGAWCQIATHYMKNPVEVMRDWVQAASPQQSHVLLPLYCSRWCYKTVCTIFSRSSDTLNKLILLLCNLSFLLHFRVLWPWRSLVCLFFYDFILLETAQVLWQDLFRWKSREDVKCSLFLSLSKPRVVTYVTISNMRETGLIIPGDFV